jgi:hypothetical protein
MAAASPVTVTGLFTSFSGPVGQGNVPGVGPDTFTYVNGETVAPQTPIAPITGMPAWFTQFPEVGTATVTFGTPVSEVDFWTTTEAIESPHNLVRFTPAPVQEVAGPGIEFLLGTLTLTNGTFWGGRGDHSFGLTVTANGGPLGTHSFSDTLVYAITSNVLDPELAADVFYLTGRPGLGSIRVFESRDGNSTGSVDLFGKIGSLTPTRFANPTGGVFLSPDVPQPPSVPEPAMLGMVAVALGAVAARRRRGTAAPPR